MNIPQNVAYEYLKSELAGCINYGLQTLQVPPYQIEQILKQYYDEVRQQAQQEFYTAEQQYKQEQEKAAQEQPTFVETKEG